MSLVSERSTTSVVRQPRQQESNEIDLVYSELDLMPVRCYACGETIRQIAIEESLRSGRSLRETFEELDYPLLCCRDLIRSQASVLNIEKEQQRENQIERTPLTIENTSGVGSTIRLIEPTQVYMDDVEEEAEFVDGYTLFMQSLQAEIDDDDE